MAQIAVIHNKFDIKGGAETVCLNTLEALQDEHNVTLISFDEPNLDDLNSFCGTDVNSVKVRHPTYLGPVFNRMIDAMNQVSGGIFGAQIKLKSALLSRIVHHTITDFDLVVSTGNELNTETPSIQYIHFPNFNGRFDESFGTNGIASFGYDWLCSRLAGVSVSEFDDTNLLTNSGWTADVIEARYGVRPEVLHPPVNTSEFYNVPLGDREHGFVSLGRISPDKQTLKIIDIIVGVRKRGHDVHLHIVGPIGNDDSEYASRVKSVAEEYEFVTIEGEVSRQKLVDIVCTHRYGIHGKRNEHFGITVAELVAGGALPFVAEGGGQVDLVNAQPELVYGNIDEAVDLIDYVLSDQSEESRLRGCLLDVKTEFGRESFQDQIRTLVNENLP